MRRQRTKPRQAASKASVNRVQRGLREALEALSFKDYDTVRRILFRLDALLGRAETR